MADAHPGVVNSTNAGRSLQVESGSQIVSREIDGEMVLLDLRSGMYYGLNQVGAFVWRLISARQGTIPVVEIVDAVVGEFDVEGATARRDLDQLLLELTSNRLVSVRG